MTLRSILTWMGFAPAPVTMTFRKAPKLAEDMGCTGFLTTESNLTAAQIDLIKETWARSFRGNLRDGDRVVFFGGVMTKTGGDHG